MEAHVGQSLFAETRQEGAALSNRKEKGSDDEEVIVMKSLISEPVGARKLPATDYPTSRHDGRPARVLRSE